MIVRVNNYSANKSTLNSMSFLQGAKLWHLLRLVFELHTLGGLPAGLGQQGRPAEACASRPMA